MLSCIRLFATPWTAACQAFLSITNSQSLRKLMSIESVMPSNYLILCRPLLLSPSIFPSIRVSLSARAQVVSAVKGRRKALGAPSTRLTGDQEVALLTACPRFWSLLSISFPTIPSILTLTTKQENSRLQLSATDQMWGSGRRQVSGVMSW